MQKRSTFRFLDDALNQRLLALLRKGDVRYDVAKDGTVRYAPGDEEVVESEFIGPVRDSIFPNWQVLTCPPAWVERYQQYMNEQGIPFTVEASNGEVWFLLPRKYRPYRWKITDPKKSQRVAS
jgi:hypothetical protein